MNNRHILAAAAVLALTSPVYAGHLGGLGGMGRLGGAGGLGGNLSGFGGDGRLSGRGSLESHGTFNDALGSVNTKPVSKVAGKTADKVQGAATSASQAGTAAPSTAKRVESSGIAESADQTVNAGGHNASAGANGSMDAQRSGASTSAKVTGTASESSN